MTDIDASGGSRAPHMLRDQTIHPGPGIRLVQSMSYGQNDEQPMPYKPGTPSLPAGTPDQSTLLYGNITAYPSTGSGVEGTHAFQLHDAQQQQLPESAPAPKTDPLELSLLASYLEVVRQTQGDAAAAEAMAASGADATAIGNALSNSPRLQQGAHSAADSPHLAVEQADGAVLPATADGPLAAVDDSLAIDNLLGFIKQRKLTGLPQGVSTGRRSSSGAASTASSASAAAAGAQQGPGAAGRKIWIQPSGPRRPGEGVENEEQGILSAEEVPTTGEVMMRITLLAAGFVIGPSGASVREIVRLTGADVNSWTESAGTHRGRRPARIFVIKGEPRCVAQAMYIITAAVDRYKELCEGKYTGQSVPRAQNVLGVTFSYQPPPKSVVPFAASLKELYAPMNSIAAQGKFGPPSPPGLFPNLRMPALQGFRGVANPYDPNSWSAMMTAAAQMGMNPFAALAAAGNPSAATMGFNPCTNLLAYNQPSAMFNPVAGFGTAPNFMAGYNPASLNPMNEALGGFGLNPSAPGMVPMMNPGTSAALHYTGDMFGGGASLLGGGGLGMDIAGTHGLDEGAASHAGYHDMWGAAVGPNVFDPTNMAGLMNAGNLYMPAAAGAVDRGTGVTADAGAAYDPAAAMAAMRLEASTAAMNSNNPAPPFGSALPAEIGVADCTSIEGANTRLVGRAQSPTVPGFSTEKGAAATTRHAVGAVSADGVHHAVAPAQAGAWVTGVASAASQHPRQVPAFQPAPAAAPQSSSADVITPRSPPPRSAPHGQHQSPHMLGGYAPLFPPMSPAGHMMAYAPVPGMPAFAAPSPVRILRDKSGQPVPYVELGGTTYFPASPMPPPAAMVHLPHAHQLPQLNELRSGARSNQQQSAGANEAVHVVDERGGSGGSYVSHGEGGSGGQQRRVGGGRPPSGSTAMRTPDAALQLLQDNPYLVQDTIGSNKSPDTNQHSNRYHGSGSSSSGGGSGGRQYTRGSPRRPYAPSPRQQGAWQVKRVAGSTNSVGAAGTAAAIDNSDVSEQRQRSSGLHAGAGFSGRDVELDGYKASNISSYSQKSADRDRRDGSYGRSDQLLSSNAPLERDATGVSGKSGLGVIPESDVAAIGSPPRHSSGGMYNRAASYGLLGAQDPIVSPGRITLASKVKSARFSAAAQAAASGKTSPGTE